MSDDLQDRGPPDRTRINVNEEGELRYWSEKLGMSEKTLKGVVSKVGDRVQDVERELANGGR